MTRFKSKSSVFTDRLKGLIQKLLIYISMKTFLLIFPQIRGTEGLFLGGGGF